MTLNIEGIGNFKNIIEANVLFAALYCTYIDPVQFGFLAEFYLRQSTPMAESADIFSNNFSNFHKVKLLMERI